MRRRLFESEFVRGGGVTPRGRAAALACLIFLSAFLLAGCSDETTEPGGTTNESASAPGNAPPKSDEGYIRAMPNPVPPGDDLGKTTVTWNTKGDLGDVKVYVVVDGEPESLFSHSTGSSVEAPWIQAGKNYEFRLYSEKGGKRRLIDKVQVTRAP